MRSIALALIAALGFASQVWALPATVPSGGGHEIVDDVNGALPNQPLLTFIGAGATCVDGAGSTDCTFTSGGGSAHVIQDQGSSLASQPNLDFVGGGIGCEDNPGNTSSECRVPSGANFSYIYEATFGGDPAPGTIEFGPGTNLTLATLASLDNLDSFGIGRSDSLTLLGTGNTFTITDEPTGNQFLFLIIGPHTTNLDNVNFDIEFVRGTTGQTIITDGNPSVFKSEFTLPDRSNSVTYTIVAGTSAPATGEISCNTTACTEGVNRVNVHKTSLRGFDFDNIGARVGLRDVLYIVDSQGEIGLFAEVTETIDQTTYWQFNVSQLVGNTNVFPAGDPGHITFDIGAGTTAPFILEQFYTGFSLTTDIGGLCVEPTPIEINTGPVVGGITCGINDLATVHGQLVLDDRFDLSVGTFTLELQAVDTQATPTGSMLGDVAGLCVGNGEQILGIPSFGSEVALDLTFDTQYRIESVVSVAFTPAGPCQPNDTLFWYYQIDGTAPADHNVITTPIIGAVIRYTVDGIN